MNRRCLCIVVAALCLLLAAPLAAEAQQVGKVARLGWLVNSTPATHATDPSAKASVNQLRELGYVEGQSLVIERQCAERIANFSALGQWSPPFVAPSR